MMTTYNRARPVKPKLSELAPAERCIVVALIELQRRRAERRTAAKAAA